MKVSLGDTTTGLRDDTGSSDHLYRCHRTDFEDARQRLSTGPARRFKDPIDPEIPRVTAGCYTIWNEAGQFVYAGMAGRTLSSEAIKAAQADPSARITGLRDRLATHRSGRRSGDQFSVYVFDRFVLGTLLAEAISEAVAGTRRLDDDIRSFIRAHLTYRWVATPSGADAYALEAVLVTPGIDGSLPYLNPGHVEEA